jgi:ParB family transcriptional regulator, chromosome partitioning protein
VDESLIDRKGVRVTRKSGLGRGLDALLPAGDVPLSDGAPGLRDVPTEAIDPNPRQPRRTWSRPALAELAESMKQLGVLQPLLVRAIGDRFELIAGERRLRAARLAGLSRVPVVVVQTDAEGSLERALVENLHREDLNPIEEAAGYKQLIEEGGLTQETLARRVGKNRATIANALRLLELPVSIQRLMIEGRLSAGHGKALLALTGNPFQQRLATRVAHDGMSVRETEDLVRRYHAMAVGPADGNGPGTAERPALVSEAQRELAERLQTRVRVEMGRRKGKIVLDFVSLDELSRLVKIILGDQPAASTVRVQSGDAPR